jgi:hypothetical protein
VTSASRRRIAACGARGRPPGERLRDEAVRPCRLGRGEQVLGALGAQAVGHGEALVDVAEVEVAAQRGHLVDDRVGRRSRDGAHDGLAVQAVHQDGVGPEVAQTRGLRLGAGRAGDRVAAGDQCGDHRAADGSGRTGDEDVHAPRTRRPVTL